MPREHLSDLERLWKESLDLTCTGYCQLVIFRQLIHTQDSNDILQRFVVLQIPKTTATYTIGKVFVIKCLLFFLNIVDCAILFQWNWKIPGMLNVATNQIWVSVVLRLTEALLVLCGFLPFQDLAPQWFIITEIFLAFTFFSQLFTVIHPPVMEVELFHRQLFSAGHRVVIVVVVVVIIIIFIHFVP